MRSSRLMLMLALAGGPTFAEFDFSREIGTILTRKGCNGASCHGGVKGRGGFKLSSGGFHPKEDYEWIVKGGVYQVLTSESESEEVSIIVHQFKRRKS